MMVVTISMSNNFFELSFDYIQKNVVDTKDLIVEDKQGIGQALKADSCQKHTSFADNFIFLELSY